MTRTALNAIAADASVGAVVTGYTLGVRLPSHTDSTSLATRIATISHGVTLLVVAGNWGDFTSVRRVTPSPHPASRLAFRRAMRATS